MIYLFVGQNKIKLVALSKTFLGQYNISFFQKTHQTDFLEQGRVRNVDLLASAVKEALSLSFPKEVKESQVFLILPDQSFHFLRYDVPADISDSVVLSYVKDKARSESSFDIEEATYDYLLIQKDNQSKVLFFAQEQEVFQPFEEVFHLLGIKVKSILPESLTYFKLFEKTLRSGKKENILYIHYDEKSSFGYLFDSLGPLQKEPLFFDPPLEDSLKSAVKKLEEEGIKFNRIVLSGPGSQNVRQDVFTKKVGLWTNPLSKIVLNFYKDYLKILVLDSDKKFPYLEFDVCLGGFIFDLENPVFSLVKKRSVRQAVKMPKFKFSLPSLSAVFKIIKPRDLVIFVISFLVSFSIIFYFRPLSGFIKAPPVFKSQPTQTPTPQPPSPTPTVAFARGDLKIKILNGVGVAGKAVEVKEILADKDYGEILVDNADRFDYEKTEIQVKEDKKQAVEFLKEDFKKYVKVEKTSSLPKDSSADLILIIGADFE